MPISFSEARQIELETYYLSEEEYLAEREAEDAEEGEER